MLRYHDCVICSCCETTWLQVRSADVVNSTKNTNQKQQHKPGTTRRQKTKCTNLSVNSTLIEHVFRHLIRFRFAPSSFASEDLGLSAPAAEHTGRDGLEGFTSVPRAPQPAAPVNAFEPCSIGGPSRPQLSLEMLQSRE